MSTFTSAYFKSGILRGRSKYNTYYSVLSFASFDSRTKITYTLCKLDKLL